MITTGPRVDLSSLDPGRLAPQRAHTAGDRHAARIRELLARVKQPAETPETDENAEVWR